MEKKLGKRASSTFNTLETEEGQVIILFLAVIENKFKIEVKDENLTIKFEKLDRPEIFRIEVVHRERILKTLVLTPTEIKDIANILSLARIN